MPPVSESLIIPSSHLSGFLNNKITYFLKEGVLPLPSDLTPH